MLCSSFSECIEYDGLMGTRVIFVIRSRLGMDGCSASQHHDVNKASELTTVWTLALPPVFIFLWPHPTTFEPICC